MYGTIALYRIYFNIARRSAWTIAFLLLSFGNFGFIQNYAHAAGAAYAGGASLTDGAGTFLGGEFAMNTFNDAVNPHSGVVSTAAPVLPWQYVAVAFALLAAAAVYVFARSASSARKIKIARNISIKTARSAA
ncbi:MAG: hypothetical protein WAN50_01415 [Minisyncoccia bacterium]